jgi:uncharacterized protein (TIGR03435 family)
VNFGFKPLDLSYTGTLSPDGNTITGSRTQAGERIAINLQRVSEADTWAVPEPLKPMPANADPAYEVATIKPSDPNGGGRYWGQTGSHVVMMNATVSGLLQICYGLHGKQIVNAADWLDRDKFDIDGVPDVEGQASREQIQSMFRKLLASRFGLKYHIEKRELAVFAITVAKGGPRMTVSAPGQQADSFAFRGLGDLIVRNETMADFANGMQRSVMDKPVVDHTGLTDRYDFNLKWTPDESQFVPLGEKITPPANQNPNAPPDLSTALQEELGLKMENTRAMVDTFVIDHVERPGEN